MSGPPTTTVAIDVREPFDGPADAWAPGGVMDDVRFVEPAPAPTPAGGPESRTGRRRPIVTGAALAAVVVVATGVFVGSRPGGSGSPETEPASRAAAGLDPAGTRAWSELGEWSRVVPVEPAETLPPFDASGPVDVEFVALGAGGDLSRVDLGRRVVIRQSDPAMSATRSVVLAAGDRVATGVGPAPDPDTGAIGFVLEGDRLRPVIDSDSPLYRGVDGGHLWRVVRIDTDTRVAELIDVETGEIEQTLDLGFWPVRGEDGGGGLVLDVNGARTAVDAAGQTHIPDGTPLGYGPTTFYTRECTGGAGVGCTVLRTDRSTGSATLVDADVLLSATNEFGPRQPGSTAVSPDGEVLLVRRSDSGLSWAMVDTATGVDVEAPGPAVGDPIIWSTDSRFAVFLSGRRVRLYDRVAESIEVLPLPTDIVAISSLPGTP